MKKFRIQILLSLIFCLLVIPVTGQNKKVEKADEAFEAGEYYDAIDLYKDAYSMVKNKELKTEIVFRIAECYRLTNEPVKAELWYKKAIDRGYMDPTAILYFAQTKKRKVRRSHRRIQKIWPAGPQRPQKQ